MIVIGDSGPLISLAVIDTLDILEKLYGQIYILALFLSDCWMQKDFTKNR
jgi:predicted nucleic acid-binding protein